MAGLGTVIPVHPRARKGCASPDLHQLQSILARVEWNSCANASHMVAPHRVPLRYRLINATFSTQHVLFRRSSIPPNYLQTSKRMAFHRTRVALRFQGRPPVARATSSNRYESLQQQSSIMCSCMVLSRSTASHGVIDVARRALHERSQAHTQLGGGGEKGGRGKGFCRRVSPKARRAWARLLPLLSRPPRQWSQAFV